MILIDRTIEKERVWIDDLESNVHYVDCLILEGDDGVRLREMMFSRCEFQTTNFVRSEIMDVVFEHCDFSNCEFDNSHVYRSEFKHCKLMAASLYECFVKDVLFERCMLNYANFSSTKVENLSFKGGTAIESSFMNMKQKKVSFEEMDLEGSNFSETSLKGIDLSKSYFVNIIYSPHLLRGVILNSSQAESIILSMGVEIR